MWPHEHKTWKWKGLIWNFILAGGRLLTSYSTGDVSSVRQTVEQRWRMEMETHIYHNTDLLRHNLFGQMVNSWLFHRGPALYGGYIQLPQQAGGMFDGKYRLNEIKFIFIQPELMAGVYLKHS